MNKDLQRMELDILDTAKKDLDSLPIKQASQVLKKIKLYVNGSTSNVIKLTDVKPIRYRLKTGNYRVLFYKENDTMFVTRVLPRKDTYSKKNKKNK